MSKKGEESVNTKALWRISVLLKQYGTEQVNYGMSTWYAIIKSDYMEQHGENIWYNIKDKNCT